MIILVGLQNGEKVAYPVGAPEVYNEPDNIKELVEEPVVGGAAIQLADTDMDNIMEKLGFNQKSLSQITG